MMNLWFTEDLAIVPGTRLSVRIVAAIHAEQSPFQQISIYDTVGCGRMLTLDNVIQTTEFDEFAYHEMISHVPLFAHPDPRKVLIIGGGDGGTVREAIRHPNIERIDMCEIDRRVVELCIEHMPALSNRLNDPRVRLLYEDGAAWAKKHKNEYDVILVDSSDPIGPAEVLFREPFYRSCMDALKDDGILVTQAENFFLHPTIIREIFDFGKRLFPVHQYYYTTVPTYPGGMIGFTFFSKRYRNADNFEAKLQGPGYDFVKNLRYWNPEIQRTAFLLPQFARENIE